MSVILWWKCAVSHLQGDRGAPGPRGPPVSWVIPWTHCSKFIILVLNMLLKCYSHTFPYASLPIWYLYFITIISVSHQPIIFKSSASKCLKTTGPVPTLSQQIHKFGHATVRLIGLLALRLLRVCRRAKKEVGQQDYKLNERYKTLPQALTFLPVMTDFHLQ